MHRLWDKMGPIPWFIPTQATNGNPRELRRYVFFHGDGQKQLLNQTLRHVTIADN